MVADWLIHFFLKTPFIILNVYDFVISDLPLFKKTLKTGLRFICKRLPEMLGSKTGLFRNKSLIIWDKVS